MSVLRGALPTDGFTIIPNAWLRDPALSARAKGLLCYMASHAEGYILTVAQMRREMKDGEDSIRSALAELEAAGYLTKERQREASGKLGAYEWTLGVSAGQNQTGLPSLGKASLVKPATKKTTQEKTTQEDDQEPSFADKSAPTAQTILAAFIDWLALPAQGSVRLSGRAIGIYAKAIKELLSEGFEEGLLKRALAAMHDRGLTGRPTLLHSFVVEVQQARPTSGAPSSKPFVQQADEYKADKARRTQLRSELIDEALKQAEEAGVEISVMEVAKLVDDLIESGQVDLDNHNGLNTNVPSLYSGHQDVITVDVEEVTGS